MVCVLACGDNCFVRNQPKQNSIKECLYLTSGDVGVVLQALQYHLQLKEYNVKTMALSLVSQAVQLVRSGMGVGE